MYRRTLPINGRLTLNRYASHDLARTQLVLQAARWAVVAV